MTDPLPTRWLSRAAARHNVPHTRTGRLIVPAHPLGPSGGGGATADSAFSRMRPYVELPYVPNYTCIVRVYLYR
eukprot:COSAG01_NODE_12845_length_1676_cov_1.986049_2_plen_74_part_00